jgi:hypothetical protein
MGTEETSKLARTRPLENYGSPQRMEASRSAMATRRLRATEPSTLGEPVADLPWQEALTSALLLFRRYEQGVAEQGGALEWCDRLRRLHAVYDHYCAGLDDAPRFLWARLFRDALFVPHSGGYRALTEIIEGTAEGADVEGLAEAYEVDPDLLRDAVPALV